MLMSFYYDSFTGKRASACLWLSMKILAPSLVNIMAVDRQLKNKV